MESFATPYPVLFNDGKEDHDRGRVGIYPNLLFTKFQSQIAHLVGVPAAKISIVLICQRSPNVTDKSQKLPITKSTNFGILLNQHHPSRDRGCYFYATLRKSKKERKNGVSKVVGDMAAGEIILLKRGEALPRPAETGAQDQKVTAVEEKQIPQAEGTATATTAEKTCSACGSSSITFHPCVGDKQVTVHGPSPFGPISRPGKVAVNDSVNLVNYLVSFS